MTNRQCHLLNKSSYILIKTLLLEMSQEPEKILKNVSVEKYISERCHLGRSVIMKILSDLRKGGYIEINRGKLVKVIKLPERY
jgi:CRP-like cAMP-binding protein